MRRCFSTSPISGTRTLVPIDRRCAGSDDAGPHHLAVNPVMRTYRCLLVCLLCFLSRGAKAQLTARDTAALVDAVAERIQTQFGTGAGREPSVIVARTTLGPDVRFAMRVSAALRTRDSSFIVEAPTRFTRRIQLGPLGLVAGDTATITLWLARCTGTPPIYSAHDASFAFRHVGDQWVYVERNVGGSGAGNNGCPW
jgi:hypothetical protein